MRKQSGAGAEKSKGENTEVQKEYMLNLEVPFEFEGETYDAIDLSGMPDAKSEDLCEVDREASRMGDVSADGMHPEITRRYAMLFACKINRKPYHWLNNMSARDSINLRRVVTLFFYGQA